MSVRETSTFNASNAFSYALSHLCDESICTFQLLKTAPSSLR